MKLRFEKIDKNDYEIFKVFEKWESDPMIKPFITPRRSVEEVPDSLAIDMMKAAKASDSKHIYVLYDGDLPIGSTSIDTKFPFLKSQFINVAWISILIGNREYWGLGLSKLMMNHLEEEAKKLKCDYIELGVFEFNIKARQLYLSMNYDIVETVKKFVYHEGKWQDDIRMIKKLSN